MGTDFRSSDPDSRQTARDTVVLIFIGIRINQRDAIDDGTQRIGRLLRNHDIGLGQFRKFFDKILQLLDEIVQSH